MLNNQYSINIQFYLKNKYSIIKVAIPPTMADTVP